MLATLRDYGLVFTERVSLFCDSTSAISVGKNSCLHSRSKHIDIRFHLLRDQYEKGVVDLIHIDTDDQLADILTKPLSGSTRARPALVPLLHSRVPFKPAAPFPLFKPPAKRPLMAMMAAPHCRLFHSILPAINRRPSSASLFLRHSRSPPTLSHSAPPQFRRWSSSG